VVRAAGRLGSRAVVAVPSTPCVPPPIRLKPSEVDGRGLPRPSVTRVTLPATCREASPAPA
jgi:hypothetical protein